MRKVWWWLVVLLAGVVSVAAGYWWALSQQPTTEPVKLAPDMTVLRTQGLQVEEKVQARAKKEGPVRAGEFVIKELSPQRYSQFDEPSHLGAARGKFFHIDRLLSE
jgi:hypothetical protein